MALATTRAATVQPGETNVDSLTSEEKATLICGTPVPESLHRVCQCGLAQDIGFMLVCAEFSDDDTGDCLTCGHAGACHERK